MNVDGGLKPQGISIFSICIFWIEVLSNFGRYNENDHCRFFYFLGNRCLVQAGWTVGKWTEWDNVLASIPNHIHMSHDIQLFPIGYPGKFFSVVCYFFSCKYVATYILFLSSFFKKYPIYQHNYIAGVQISSRVLLLQHGKNDISCLSVRICAYIKVSTAVKLGNMFWL